MESLISVLLPVWNGLRAGSGYLQRAVYSIVEQTYEGPIELIIVDDGSTDGTVDAVMQWSNSIRENWQSRRIIVVTKKHSGVTQTLNEALKHARGDFIARQDADDWSSPERFSRQVNYLKKNADVALVGSAVQVVHGRQVKQEVWYKSGGRIPKCAFRERTPLAHGSVLLRSDVMRTVGGYDPQFPHAQDYDLFWRIRRKYAVASLSDVLYFYRVHSNRVTSDRKRFQIQLACARKIRQRIQQELNE